MKWHYTNKCRERLADIESGKIKESETRSKEEIENEKSDEVQYAMMACMREKMLSAATEFGKKVWIADLGASQHMTNSNLHFFEEELVEGEVFIGDNSSMMIKSTGSLKLKFTNRDGEENVVILTKVAYVPNMMCNLLSVTSAMTNGYDLGNEK